MKTNTADTSDYVLGHSKREIQRLIRQAALFGPVTERLLRTINVRPGMRVLDLGCGAGDVSFLAAKLVGPNGAVVGIDRNQEVLNVAAERASAAGFRQIRFEQVSVESFSSDVPFDVIIGRYVLIFQPDPVEFLRAAARLVSRGGHIAFHEGRTSRTFDSQPVVPLWQLATNALRLAAQSALRYYDVTDRFVQVFLEAGLPTPRLFCEIPMGGGADLPFYSWMAETLESLLPELIKNGVPPESLGIDKLESRLRDGVVSAGSQIELPGQVCAWART